MVDFGERRVRGIQAAHHWAPGSILWAPFFSSRIISMPRWRTFQPCGFRCGIAHGNRALLSRPRHVPRTHGGVRKRRPHPQCGAFSALNITSLLCASALAPPPSLHHFSGGVSVLPPAAPPAPVPVAMTATPTHVLDHGLGLADLTKHLAVCRRSHRGRCARETEARREHQGNQE
jgi:hypothetical protein